MKKYSFARKGSAIITAIGVGVVLLIVAASVRSFTSYRTQTVIQESKRVKALGIAEAGLELAMAELLKNPMFETHKVDDGLAWGSEIERTSKLKSDDDFCLEVSGNRGTYQGTFGDGDFKVRLGRIPYKDDENTVNTDESLGYAKIEAMGRYKDTVRRIEAVINRRYPAREFLMYDGGVLSIVYGLVKDDKGKNTFATGHLYGHEGVEIGRVTMIRHRKKSNGTNQEFKDMDAIISGAGGIYVYSPVEAQFRGESQIRTIERNANFPENGNYPNAAEQNGEMPKELAGTAPELPEDMRRWLKDKTDKVSIPVSEPPFEEYKKDAVSGQIGENITYKIPHGFAGMGDKINALYIDFGTCLREGNVNKQDLPANSVIYSDKDIIIKGNPPNDISIVSEKNIFVAGDFNQAGDPTDPAHKYGFPQDFNGSALEDHDYKNRDLFEKDIKATSNKFHVAASVVAKQRVIYDYRSPVDCFENELYPYLKYKLASSLGTEDNAKEACLCPGSSANIQLKSGNGQDYLNSIDDFFKSYPIDGEGKDVHSSVGGVPTENETNPEENNDTEGDTETTVGDIANIPPTFEGGEAEKVFKEKLFKLREKGLSINQEEYDEICKEIWQSYKTNYEGTEGGVKGTISKYAKEPKYGVYALLNELYTETKEKDTKNDFLFFPEMTTNGMFISCGKLNARFYAGPDESKWFNEIGNQDNGDIGIEYITQAEPFIHRMYGSEVNLRTQDVGRIDKSYYDPPIRKKIYDSTLPLTNVAANKYELCSFVVISWRDFGASEQEFKEF